MSSDGQPASMDVEAGFNATSDGTASDAVAMEGAASDTAASDNAALHTKTRWQLNLKALFLLVALAGPALGFGSPPVYRYVRDWLAPPQYPVSNTPQLIQIQIQKSREYMERFRDQRSRPDASTARDPAGADTGIRGQVARPADR